MQLAHIDLYLAMSLSSCLFVIAVISLILTGWMSVASAQVTPKTEAEWREYLCNPHSTHAARDNNDLVIQADPARNPLESMHLGQVGHDYIVGGPDEDKIVGSPGDGCYQGNEDIDIITFDSQGTDTKYVIDDDDKKDAINCKGKPRALIIDMSEAMIRRAEILPPDVGNNCPDPTIIQPKIN
jgi:hypothetical protein